MLLRSRRVARYPSWECSVLCKFIVILYCLIAIHAPSHSAIDIRAADEIKALYPSARVHDMDSSAVSENNQKYTAALLVDNGHMWIALFKKNAGGPLKLVVTSPRWEWGPSRSIEAIKIFNQIVILSFSGSGGCCSGGATEFRFRMSNNAFPLIGSEEFYWTVDYAGEGVPNKYSEIRKSINYLTRQVIHSGRSGNAKDGENNFDGKTSYTEKEFNFSPATVWKISNFSPEKHLEFTLQTPNLCGSIGNKMRFEKYSTCIK